MNECHPKIALYLKCLLFKSSSLEHFIFIQLVILISSNKISKFNSLIFQFRNYTWIYNIKDEILHFSILTVLSQYICIKI